MYFSRWRAESSHRTRAPPHIKSYTREHVLGRLSVDSCPLIKAPAKGFANAVGDLFAGIDYA